MISFLSSKLTLDELFESFQDVLEVRTSDSQLYVLRIGDTRTLAAVSAALEPQDWARITKGVISWVVFDRHGKIEKLTLASVPENAKAPIVLKDPQLSKILELNFPDALVQSLADYFPDLFINQRPSSIYEIIKKVCAFGDRHDVKAYPELLALAVAAVSTQGKILLMPDFVKWIQARGWAQGKFEEGIATFMDISYE